MIIGVHTFELSEIQKFSRLAEQAGESNNKYTVNYHMKNQDTIIHLRSNIISKTCIGVFLCESTTSYILVYLPFQLAC